jgi:hypothetical protein
MTGGHLGAVRELFLAEPARVTERTNHRAWTLGREHTTSVAAVPPTDLDLGGQDRPAREEFQAKFGYL